MEYRSTLTSALEYAKNGQIDNWVQAYLVSDGDNQKFADGLRMVHRFYYGPIRMPLSLFVRCCGPEAHMKWVVDEKGFEEKVTSLVSAIQAGSDLPPLIVEYVNGDFDLSDGNHRYEAYMRAEVKSSHVIVWITGQTDHESFLSKYSAYLTNQ